MIQLGYLPRLRMLHTSVRDTGSFDGAILEERRRIDAGEVAGPRIFACGPILDGDPPFWSGSRVVRTAEEALNLAIPLLRAGNRLGDLGAAIQSLAESRGFSVVRDFSGHGVGFAVHEQPLVPHFGRKGTGLVIEEGMVLAIEPMINEGVPDVLSLPDGWTVVTADGRLSAQFEHTVAVTSKGPVVLTA